MEELERSDRVEIVGPDRAADVVVELRHPDCWKKLPRGKRFPAVVVVPQLISPCSEQHAFESHADDFVVDLERLVDAACAAHVRRRPKSA
jgi:hypothetical protein